ncbi:hypothetical protein [Nocardia paucivorans]|uniref:hypothetical protein n=1 Tax=Nocardia paucivorans TaxID=114259 RepID=UPI0003006253|nr:hypothetical protein [Nocardia paucivorans]
MFRRRRPLRQQVRDLTAIVDDMIDRWPRVTGTSATVDGVTGAVFGQDLVLSAWSCRNPGLGLTVGEAMQIRRQHMMCPPDDPTVCRIKPAALRLLAERGKVVPAGKGVIAPISASAFR